MKTAWFYAQRELRRRYLHFAGEFFFVGTAIFIPMTLYGYTEAVNGNGWNEQFAFFFSMVAFLLFCAAVMSQSDQYDKFFDDDRSLLRLGMPERGLMLIRAIEMIAVFCLAVPVFMFLSHVFLHVILFRYNNCLDEMPWLSHERFAGFDLPDSISMPAFDIKMLVLLLILYVILLSAAVTAYIRRSKQKHKMFDIRDKNGELYGEKRFADRNTLSAYTQAVSGRIRRRLKHTGKTVVLHLLVPVIMLCGALSSGTVRYQEDILISTESVQRPIPQSAAEEIANLEGVESVDVYIFDRYDGEQVITRITIVLCEENFHETALLISKMPALAGFEIRLNCFSEITTNLKYRMNREYFLFAAAEAFFAGMISVGFLMNDCMQMRREEMHILRSLGTDRRKRIRIKAHGNIALVLPSVVSTGGVGLAVYFVMSMYGGDRLKPEDTALAAALLGILTALTAVVSALLAVHSEKGKEKV